MYLLTTRRRVYLIVNHTAKAKKRTVMPAAVTRIVIVDDHELMREALKGMIDREDDLEVCGEAADEATAIGVVTEHEPDLAVIDLSLDEGSGLDLIKQLKASHPQLRMIVLSMHDEKLYAERAMVAGAMGFVNKKDPAGTIIEAIRRVQKDQMHLSSPMLERLARQRLCGGSKKAGLESLSNRELEVFELISQGLSTREIADRLYLSAKTVDTYRQRIKHKLNLDNASALVHHAMQWRMDGV